MREIIVLSVIGLILSNSLCTAQVVKTDPANRQDSTSNLFNANWSKHNHFIEYSAFIGFIDYHPTAGAFGYKYLYATDWNWNVKFGARVGLWGGRTGDDIPDNSARNFITYSAFLIGSMPIWKSINLECSTGIFSSKSFPTNTNTKDQEKLYSGIPYFAEKIGVDLILYEHLNIDTGVMFTFNTLSKNWNSGMYLSVGYKF